MSDDTEKPADLAIDPITWFSIRGGWLRLDNRDRIKLASIRKYSCSDYDAYLHFENGDSYTVSCFPPDGKNPHNLVGALDDFFENTKSTNAEGNGNTL